MNLPDYLVIGTITKDVVPDGFAVGGTVTYGALTAQRLGHRAAIVTSHDPSLVLPPAFDDLQLAIVPAAQTTTFHNVYRNGRRTQYLRAVSAPIQAEHIPDSWRHVPMVHLGPLAQELDESLVREFPDAMVIATPQGWFRSWDEKGVVSLGEWPAAKRVLPHLSALVLSEEDVDRDARRIQRYADLTPILVVTNGANGATVYHNGQMHRFATRPAREADPTGAGDVFAAAFLIRLYETRQARGVADPLEAVRFANVVASFSVEGDGFSAIPDRMQVERYMTQVGWL